MSTRNPTTKAEPNTNESDPLAAAGVHDEDKRAVLRALVREDTPNSGALGCMNGATYRDLADATHLARRTVRSVVSDLADAGIVAKVSSPVLVLLEDDDVRAAAVESVEAGQ